MGVKGVASRQAYGLWSWWCESQEVMEGDGMVTAPSSTSLASQGEADESGETAGKKDGKKGKVGSHYAEPGALASQVSTTD